jgi:MOSC domain-containing protein YiiM
LGRTGERIKGSITPMFTPGTPLRALLDAPVRPGRVVWVGLRAARRAALRPVEAATLDPERGLEGDHARSARRQVTLIDAAALAAIAAALGRDAVDPGDLRRNVVVAGINLHALRGARLRLGTAELLVTGECHPCSRMEEVFGTGGYNAVRGQGGLTARIVAAGRVALGDLLSRLPGDAVSRLPGDAVSRLPQDEATSAGSNPES